MPTTSGVKYSARLTGQLMAALVGLVLLVIIWQQAAAKLSPLVLPSPAETWYRLVKLYKSGTIAKQLVISLRRALTGFAIAYSIAFITAILMNRFRWVRFFLQPWLAAVQIVPTVVWLIFAVLWFGIAQEKTPIFVVTIVCLPVVLVQIKEGLAAIPIELRDLAALEPLGLYNYAVHIAWPSLRPALIGAATLGFSFAWRSVIFAEFVASNAGLGYQLSRAYHNLATDEVFAWTLVLVVVLWLWQVLVIGPWRRYSMSTEGWREPPFARDEQ